jgi:hypothetical protein
MRHILFAGATFAALCGPAFAGAPTPPVPPNVAPVNITVQTLNSAMGGGNVNSTVHAGSLTISQSLSVKTSILLGMSQSISLPGTPGGFSVP